MKYIKNVESIVIVILLVVIVAIVFHNETENLHDNMDTIELVLSNMENKYDAIVEQKNLIIAEQKKEILRLKKESIDGDE